MNHKLDQFTAEFTAVKDAIEWSSVKVSYSSYEHKIIAAEENLRRIYRVEGKARGEKRKYFLAQYDSDFGNSVQKLYDGAYKHDRIFSKNILAAVEHQTKKHRRKFEQFSLGLLQLLIRGIQVKVQNKMHITSINIRSRLSNSDYKIETSAGSAKLFFLEVQ